jgi:hypothetical protein
MEGIKGVAVIRKKQQAATATRNGEQWHVADASL